MVDNHSTDKTVEKAKAFPITIVNIDEYLPGAAINHGIRQSSGEYIAIISAHCIPTNDTWLSNLVRNLEAPGVAGVYGRQEPMSFTSDQDKRDLLNTFGLDRRVQMKDSFFHNANSLIKREVWERIPFDEKLTNIEDRVWGKAVIDAGYNLVYEPEASVYHWHGIYQNGNQERCRNVVKILETLQTDNTHGALDLDQLEIAAIVPTRGEAAALNGLPLLSYTIEAAKESQFINRIIVSTDNENSAAIARKLGAEIPFIRPGNLSDNFVDVTSVYQYTLNQLENQGYFPDLVVLLQVTFPFRTNGLIDSLLEQLTQKGLDSILATQAEYKSCWQKNNGELARIGAGFMPREFKDPIYIGLSGLVTVTHPSFLRNGERFGNKIGVVEIEDPTCAIEVRDTKALSLAEKIMPRWWEENYPQVRIRPQEPAEQKIVPLKTASKTSRTNCGGTSKPDNHAPMMMRIDF